MFDTKESIIAFISGAVAGLAAGLLLAPEELIRSRNGLAYRVANGSPDSVDLGNATTAPLSEISDDFAQLETLREQLESGQARGV